MEKALKDTSSGEKVGRAGGVGPSRQPELGLCGPGRQFEARTERAG